MKKSGLLIRIIAIGLCLTVTVYIGLIQTLSRTPLYDDVLKQQCARSLQQQSNGRVLITWLLSQNWSTVLRHGSGAQSLPRQGLIQMLEQRIKEVRGEFNETAEETAYDEQTADSQQAADCALTQGSACDQHTQADESDSLKNLRSLEREKSRRRVDYMSNTMWTYIDSSLKGLKSRASGNRSLVTAISDMQSRLQAFRNTLTGDFEALRKADDQWRKTESRTLGDLVQRRLDYLQNPANCSQARFVVCNLKQACGLGCLLHHVCYCLLVAYGTNRTLVLQQGSLLYGQHKWESVFKPLSKTCETAPAPVVRWGANKTDWESAQSLFLPLIAQIDPRPRFLPMAIPQDLASRLKVFHGDPAIWWLGQLLRYVMRSNYKIRPHIENEAKRLRFQKPIVGIHIRRTDKLFKEAVFHPLEEYMGHVDNYIQDRYRQWSVTWRVYMATDDPGVQAECEKKYPKYVFVGDKNVSRLAATDSRYSYASLVGIILDTYFLSKSDFLVCTFSSNVCRAAYALMQTYDGDASTNVRSLDKRFYFNGQRDEHVFALENHRAENDHQMSFVAGDMLRLEGNDLSGMMSKGLNLRTGKSGMFPTYKTVKEIVEVRMPTYPEVSETVS